jgi:hypothetical protein
LQPAEFKSEPLVIASKGSISSVKQKRSTA